MSARALPAADQDELADHLEAWLDFPAPPPDDFGPDGSDEELAARVDAWRAQPIGISAAELHARLKRQRDQG